MAPASVARLLAGGLVALTFVLLDAVGTPVSAASIQGGCLPGYHYAYEEVVVDGGGGWYHPPTCGGSAYFGWIGIDGQINYPSQYPYLGNPQNHSAGWLGIAFSNGGWVQEGWYEGCVGGFCRTRNLGRYTEMNNPGGPLPYEFVDYDTAPLGGSSIFLIEYGGSGCWNLYLDYSTLKKTYCSLPGSGVPQTVSEVYSSDGTVVGMPATIYGFSNPNTNNALRIKGANGFVPWSSSLSSGQTGYYDERYGQPGCNQPGNPPCAYYYFGVYNYNYYVYGVD